MDYVREGSVTSGGVGNGKPIDPPQGLESGAWKLRWFGRREKGPRPVHYAPSLAGEDRNRFERWLASVLVGEDPFMRLARELIVQCAQEDGPVLIHGETGSGKDIAAEALHEGSLRRERPPVFGALAGLGDTAWSELFGHLRGAWTGAYANHDGLFLEAHGTSLILSEITSVSMGVQAMMLRAIEKNRFRPMKGKGEVYSDARVIAMTNEPISQAISEGRFRKDLYYRLNVRNIVLPPLRARVEDLEILVPHFLKKHAPQGEEPKRVSREGMELLQKHPWPGNVRELEHLIEQAIRRTSRPFLEASLLSHLLHETVLAFPQAIATTPQEAGGPEVDLQALLAAAGRKGSKRELARQWGVSPTTVDKILKANGADSRPHEAAPKAMEASLPLRQINP